MQILIKDSKGATRKADYDGKRVSIDNRPLICGQCAGKIKNWGFNPRTTTAWDYHPEFHLQHDGDALVCPTCGTRREIVNPDKNVEFVSTTDNETGQTWYELKHQISREAWRKVAHLFQRDVELDCPDGRPWNDSITLKWATGNPEKVREVLSA